MKKAVIFDLDGVLVTTDALHYAAWKELCDGEGIPFDRATNEQLRGVSRRQSLEIILRRAERRYTDGEKDAMCARKNAAYNLLLDELTEAALLPGAREALAELRRRGVLCAVGSSSRNAKKILARTNLLPLLDAVADGTDITRSKPDPEVFLTAAAKLGVAPADCAVVEDAEAGIEAAKAGGMLAVAVGAARGCALADVRLESLYELPDAI